MENVPKNDVKLQVFEKRSCQQVPSQTYEENVYVRNVDNGDKEVDSQGEKAHELVVSNPTDGDESVNKSPHNAGKDSELHDDLAQHGGIWR